MSEAHKHSWRYIDEDDDSDLGVCACGATGVIYFGNGEVLDIKTREQHDSLLAEVERLRGENTLLQRRLVDVLLAHAINETAEVRRRLLESEHLPAELWEMRFK